MCSEVSVYIGEMARKRNLRERSRGQTVPVPLWWLDALDRVPANNHELAEAVARVTGVRMSVDKIGRVRRGEVATLESIDAISATLGLPPPVVITASLPEAQAIATARRVEAATSRLPVIKAGVVRPGHNGQPGGVQPSDADSSDGVGVRTGRRMERDRPTPSRG